MSVSTNSRSTWSMTRGTSSEAPDSVVLSTPLDEYPRAQLGNHKPFLTTSPSLIQMHGAALARDSNLLNAHNNVKAPVFDDLESVYEPTPTFSPPVQYTPPTALENASCSLESRRSTKELIHLFESTTHKETPQGHPTLPITRLDQAFRSLPEPPRKGIPHLRESFRNLLSVFGKNVKRKIKPESSSPSHAGQVPRNSIGFDDPPFSVLSRPGIRPTRKPVSAIPIKEGTLMLMDKDVPMVLWHRCVASLCPPNLLLYWEAYSGQRLSHTISLISCTDVRSVASNKIEAAECPVMDGTNAHVFEMEFKAGSCQRLAAQSVTERGSWVSAIWDVILAQQAHSSQDNLSAEVCFPSGPPLRVVNASRTTSESSVAPSPPLAALAVIPLTPPKTKGTKPGPSASPSLRSLDDMTIVQRRLARIQTQFGNSSACTRRSVDIPPGNSNKGRIPLRITRHEVPRTTEITSTSPSPSRCSSPSPSRYSPSTSVHKCDMGVYGNNTPSNHRGKVPHHSSNLLANGAQTHGSQSNLFQEGSVFDIEHWDGNYSALVQTSFSDANNEPLFMPERTLQPLYELIQDVAADHTAHQREIGDQITDLHEELRGMVDDIKCTYSNDNPSGVLPKPLSDLRETMESLLRVIEALDVDGLRQKLDAMKREFDAPSLHENSDNMHQISAVAAYDSPPLSIAPLSNSLVEKLDAIATPMTAVLEKLETMNDRDPSILRKIEEWQMQVGESSEAVDVRFSDLHAKLDALNAKLDTSNLGSKLDRLLAICPSLTNEGSAPHQTETMHAVSHEGGNTDQLQELLVMMTDEREHRALQLQQQADSVRYLHELNGWMEAFVTNTYGNSQFQTIATGVEQLCKELVPAAQLPNLPDQHPGTTCEAGAKTLLAEIHGFLKEVRDRQQDSSALQERLVSVMEPARNESSDSSQQAIDAVLAVLEQQSKQQTGLLRSIAAELSSDIKGERLRFVEAMQAATSVNVQLQVDEFKKHLAKEVMIMLQDVGKLARSRERRFLEQEIADLFAQHQRGEDPLITRASPHRSNPSEDPSTIGPQHLQLPTPRPAGAIKRPLPTPMPSPQTAHNPRTLPVWRRS